MKRIITALSAAGIALATLTAVPTVNAAPRPCVSDSQGMQRCMIPSPAVGKDVEVLIRPAKTANNPRVALFLDGMYIVGDSSGWIRDSRAVDHLANEDATLVFPLPESGTLYTDWGTGGPDYTTFYTQELPRWLESNFGVRGGGVGHTMVAGISAGAFGAMSLAAQRPELYRSVVALSGFYDPNTPAQRVVTDVRPANDQRTPEHLRRSPWQTQADRNRANPTVNIDKLDMPVEVAMASGIHNFATLDGDPQAVAASIFEGGPLEAGSVVLTAEFAAQAAARGKTNIRFHYDVIGTHSWDTWNRAAWDQGLVYRALRHI